MEGQSEYARVMAALYSIPKLPLYLRAKDGVEPKNESENTVIQIDIRRLNHDITAKGILSDKVAQLANAPSIRAV